MDHNRAKYINAFTTSFPCLLPSFSLSPRLSFFFFAAPPFRRLRSFFLFRGLSLWQPGTSGRCPILSFLIALYIPRRWRTVATQITASYIHYSREYAALAHITCRRDNAQSEVLSASPYRFLVPLRKGPSTASLIVVAYCSCELRTVKTRFGSDCAEIDMTRDLFLGSLMTIV